MAILEEEGGEGRGERVRLGWRVERACLLRLSGGRERGGWTGASV